VVVRHEELRRHLRGAFTIPELINAIQTSEKRDLEVDAPKGQPGPKKGKELCIYKETVATPETTYVNGWFRGRLFEFTYHHETGNIIFGTRPFIKGGYISCEPLLANEQIELRKTWLHRAKD
jgi:hypothetical protein